MFFKYFDLWINLLDRSEVIPILYQIPLFCRLSCVGGLICKQHDWWERGSRWPQAQLGLREPGFSRVHFYPTPETVVNSGVI